MDYNKENVLSGTQYSHIGHFGYHFGHHFEYIEYVNKSNLHNFQGDRIRDTYEDVSLVQ